MLLPEMPLRLEMLNESEISPEIDIAIRNLLCLCFPERAEIFQQKRAWHNCIPEFTLLGFDQATGELVGHVAVIARRITCPRNHSVLVAGIQGVAVTPALRGTLPHERRLSGQLLRAAEAEATRREIPFGLLFCKPPLRKVYEPLGWKVVDQQITMRNAQGEVVLLPHVHVPMVKELSDQSFPDGRLDLRGRDW